MEASDTVIHAEGCEALEEDGACDCGALEQAEATWPVAFEQGRREVVEWVERHLWSKPCVSVLRGTKSLWEKKLMEWGGID